MKLKLTLLACLFCSISTLLNAQDVILTQSGGTRETFTQDKLKNPPTAVKYRPTSIVIKSATEFTNKINDGSDAIKGNGYNTTANALGTITSVGDFSPNFIAGQDAGASTLTIQIRITKSGYYTITTDVVNGIMFYATDIAELKTGEDGKEIAEDKTITLKALGTPFKKGDFNYQVSFGGSKKASNKLSITSALGGHDLTVAQTPKFKRTVAGAQPAQYVFKGSLQALNPAAPNAEIDVDVAFANNGKYALCTNIVNGVFFFSSVDGTTAAKTFKMRAYGTGISDGSKTFTLTLEAPEKLSVPFTKAESNAFSYAIVNTVKKIEFTDGTTTFSFAFNTGGGANGNDDDGNNGEDAGSAFMNYLSEKYGEGTFKITPYGIIMNTIIDGEDYPYGGPNYVHIFLDELGNSLITSIPQGIPEMQYVVHVVYFTKSDDGKNVLYGVKATKGSFLGGVKIENNIKKSDVEIQSGERDKVQPGITECKLVIRTSDTDIGFDVYRYEDKKQAKKLSYTITMTNTYTASMSVGLLSSWLQNPTYTLVNDPNNADLKVAKASDLHNRGFASVFATLYTSPITIIKYYSNRKKIRKTGNVTDIKDPVADFQLHSKDYLYMRPVWERIYPTIGVGLSDKVFQNLFFGLNWEFARGGSFFAGGHYGKVNVFEGAPKGFEFGKTNITEDAFNLYSNTKWKIGWAIGASVDFNIVGNLFK